MDYVFLSTLCAIAGTAIMIFIYNYLYGIYREPHLGGWITGLLIHFTRIVLFESGWMRMKFTIYYLI